jgi:hypothetical protein
VVTLGTNLLHPFEARFTTVTSNIVRNNTFDILAADSGTWGNDIDVRPFHMSSARSPVVQILAPVASGQVELASAAGFYPGAWVEFDRGQNKVRRQVTGVNGRVITVTPPFALLTDLGAQAPATETLASVCEFGLTVTFEDVSEEFRGLTLANIPGRFYFDRIHNRSSLIDVTQPPVSGTDPLQFPSADDGLSMHPALGTNGAAPIDLDYVGVDGGPGNRTGLQSMIDIENVSLIAAPGITDQTVQQAMVDHCELMRYRVALLDPEPIASGAPTYLNDIQEQRSRFDTKYAALYCPRVVVTDPLTKTDIPVPPSGHVAGICARVDEERGVHKAPANEVIRGIVDIELVLNKGEQDILNPYPSNINVIRDFRHQGRAIRVWGARAITSETAWKYLNVRRLFNFVEASLDRGTQPYIFEPNDEHLWARVRQAISNFLGTVWRDGALFGSKEEEAFFVRCDRTTMTEDDIDNGRLIIIVGLAAVKPTEFLIIRIGQKSGLTTVEELL